MKVPKISSQTNTLPIFNRQLTLVTKRVTQKRNLLTTLAFFSFLGVSLSTATPAKALPLRLDRLYFVENGPVYLQRYNWSDFYSTYPRTMLTKEDLLYVPPGTQVVLLCTDGVLRDWVGAGVGSVGTVCPGRVRMYRPGFGISERWGASDSTVPYVITPRSGQILTETPTFQWNTVEGVEQYEVTLQQRKGGDWIDIWTETSNQNSLCYPSDQPALEPGNEYALKVNIAGDPEQMEVLSERPVFSIVGGEEKQDIEASIATVEALEIDQPAKTLILVEDVYPSYKLFAQGINGLETLLESGYETAQVHRLLGDYAVRTGLELPAEKNYLAAIHLAEANNAVEEKALAIWGLGTVYSRTGKDEPARTYLQQARKIAEEIDDIELIEKIDAELVRVSE